MALDGSFLHHLRKEILETALNAKVDKIYQPNREDLVLSLRTRYDTYKLLLSARANSARVQFTTEQIENPKQPPMLCMLLRKRLTSAKLVDVRQSELERVLFFDFDAYNELGDLVRLTLVSEIMGRYSNVMFLDGNGVIIDALKRVDEEMSSERLVLPGLPYRSPPPQNKLSLLTESPERILSVMEQSVKQREVSNQLLDTLQGVSPIVCRELENRIGAAGATVAQLQPTQRQQLLKELTRLSQTVIACSGHPCVAVNHDTGKPMDFSFLEISQYGSLARLETPETFSEALDSFYRERDRMERMKVKTQGLHRILSTAAERLSRKINLQRGELQQCTEREHLKICGDLISANLYQLKKGDTVATLCNFYEPEQPMVTVKLDPLRTPSQNAQKYYKEYRKAKTAEEKLREQISMAEQELQYVDSVQEALSRTTTEQELSEIRQELLEQGYIRQQKQKKNQKGKLAPAGSPMEFQSSDGFQILVGRNNRQNDYLTMKRANNNDLWLHVKNHPGSHTVIVSNHREITETAILEAAQIAAYYSRCRESSQVPVDYTQVRHVSKPNGAKPGMVIYVQYQTAYVTPKQPEETTTK